MVRLKGPVAYHVLAAEPISIPYGSIKSADFLSEFNPLRLFQFLMVRLKDCCSVPKYSSIVNFNSLWFD